MLCTGDEIFFIFSIRSREYYASTNIVDSMLCAGEKGKGACPADAGGPLVARYTSPELCLGVTPALIRNTLGFTLKSSTLSIGSIRL